MAPDILLIGTGITGALSAALLQRSLPTANITIWDKARGAGGRMSRSISPKDSTCTADLGAQYITTTTEKMSKYDDLYCPLIRDGVLEDLTANIIGMKKYQDDVRHFVAPAGMNSLVKYFLRDTPKENIRFGSRVTAIDERDGKFRVTSENLTSSADVIVSTVPVPQFLEFSGSVRDFVKNEAELGSVEYSSRFVLVLFFDKAVKFPATDWACQYLEHEFLRYVSIDNLKRNRPDEPVAVIFHTSVQFGMENLEVSLPDMEPILMKAVRDMFPDWPQPSATRCHKWRYSQIVKPFEGTPGCVLLNENPTLILGGDAFSESTFDGCIYSASKIAETVNGIWQS